MLLINKNTGNITQKDENDDCEHKCKETPISHGVEMTEAMEAPNYPGAEMTKIMEAPNSSGAEVTEATRPKCATKSSSSVKLKYGIIDFGDIMYSCSLFELASSVAYAMMQEDTNGDVYLKRGKFVIQGYLSKFDMDPLEKDILFACVCSRYCIELVNLQAEALKQREENSHNINPCEKEGWEQLTKLMELGSSKVYEYWFKDGKLTT